VALVTLVYYSDTYYGETIAAADFPRYEARAEDLILGLIRKTAAEAAALPEAILTAVQKAICAQIEYLWEYGITVATFGKSGSGFTVGKVSVQDGSSQGAAAGPGSMIAPAVYVYLEQTGLLNPAVATAGEPPQVWGWWL